MGKYRTLGTFFDRIFPNDLNANFNDIDADVQAQKKRVDDLIVANPQPSEVQDARGGFTVLRDRLNDTDAQLAENTNKLKEQVVHLTKYGATGDDLTDNSQAFAAAMASNEMYFFLPAGNYRISKSFVLKQGVTLVLHPNAVIKPTQDIDVIVMKPRAKVMGKGKVDCSILTSFTKAAVLFDGVDLFGGGDNHVLDGINLVGKSLSSGTGIKLNCSSVGSYIIWVLVKNVYMRNFNRGIWLNVPPVSSTVYNYINGNVFDRITFGDCLTNIYVDGDHSNNGKNGADGNTFTFVGQATSNGEKVIYSSGYNNSFEGIVFDIGNSGLTPIYAELTPSSRYNKILTNGYLSYIKDVGFNNFISDKYSELTQSQVFEPLAAYSYSSEGNVVLGNKLIGNQDDWLAYSYARHTITQTQGNPVSSGALNSITNINPSTNANWNLSQTDPNIIFEIDLSAEKMNTPRFLGLVFEYGQRPQAITVNLFDDGIGQKTVFSTTTNNKDVVTIPTLGFGLNTVNKIQVIMGSPKNLTSIRMVRIWASVAGSIGQSWLPRSGGKVYGDIDLNKRKIINHVFEQNTSVNRPTSPLTGQAFYDTTLKKPIWYNGSTWTDATGTIV